MTRLGVKLAQRQAEVARERALAAAKALGEALNLPAGEGFDLDWPKLRGEMELAAGLLAWAERRLARHLDEANRKEK